MRSWFITGCSTGLGRAIATRVLESGDCAAVTSRNARDVEDIVVIAPGRAVGLAVDVTRPEEIVRAVETAVARFGKIDVLVNNAGYGFVAAIEEGEEDAVRAMFDVNFFGAWAVIRAVLPSMRARRRGHIVNMSSLTGRVANPATGFYSATKHALEGLTGALAREVEPLGIRVTAVAPGMFRTDFSGRSLHRGARPIADYAHVHERMALVASVSGHQQGDPARLAAAIMEIVEAPDPPRQLLLGADAFRATVARLDECRAEMDAWQELSCSTDFAD